MVHASERNRSAVGILETTAEVYLSKAKNSGLFKCDSQVGPNGSSDYTLGVLKCKGPYLSLTLKCERCAENSAKRNADRSGDYYAHDAEAASWLKNKSSSRLHEKTEFLWMAKTPGSYVAEGDILSFVSPDGTAIGELTIPYVTSYADLDEFARNFCKE